MSKEEELLIEDHIQDLNLEIKTARNDIEYYKTKGINADERLFAAKLKKDELVTKLIKLKAIAYFEEVSDRDIDIERFRNILPDILEKIK